MVGRRLLGVAVGLSLMMAAVSPMPARATATSYDVSFPPAAPVVNTTLVNFVVSGSTSCSASAFATQHFYDYAGGGNVSGAVGGPGQIGGGSGAWICANFGNMVWAPPGGFATGTQYRLSVQWGGDHGDTATFYKVTGAVGSGFSSSGSALITSTSCTGTLNDGSLNGSSGCLTQPTPVDFTATSGMAGISMMVSHASTIGIHSFRVDGLVMAGGDCAGTGNLAGGGGLVEANWGSFYSSSIEACLSSGGGDTVQSFVVSIPSGGLVSFNSLFCTDGNYRTVSWYFLVGSSSVAAGAYRTNVACINSGSPVSRTVTATAPSGAYGLQVVIEGHVFQESHHVVVDIAPGDVGGDVPGGGAAEGCTAPTGGWLDTDWLGYVGCVLINGFASLPSFIANAIWVVIGPLYAAVTGIATLVNSIANYILDLPGVLAGMFLDMFVTGPIADLMGWVSGMFDMLTGLPGAIWDAATAPLDALAGLVGTTINGVLVALFVPDTLNVSSAVAGLTSAADGKIPFVWISEVGGVLGDMTSGAAMAGAPLTWSMDVMGSNVTIDPTAVSGPVSGFRPVLVGMVGFGLAWAILGQIGGALGMHRPESAA